MGAIDKVIALAESEVGYHEKASNAGLDDKLTNTGAANYTKYARDLDEVPGFYNGAKQGFAWCDLFVDWLFVQCFGAEKAREMLYQPKQSAGAGCTYSAQYFKANGAFIPRGSGTPQPGDQIFFGNASCSTHTGLVVCVSDDKVFTIEGNSSDQVAKRSYDLNYANIYGYGRPKWSAVEENTENTGIPKLENTEVQASENTKTQASNSTEMAVNKAACVSISLPELEGGDTGREVKTLQALLKGYGYDPGEIDGEFGPKTRQAVEAYQSAHGLESDGICGKNTWTCLLTKNRRVGIN